MSSVFARRLPLALWGAVAVAGVGLASYVAFLELRTTPTERVNAYIRELNAVQRRVAVERSSVNWWYEQFTTSTPPPPTLLPRLREAERTIALLRTRVDALEPPPQARALHAAFLAKLRTDEQLARDVTATARYVGEVSAVGPRLTRLAAAFRRRLAAAETSDAQAEAFGRYAAAIAAVRKDARAIEAPAAFAPSHRELLRRLDRTVVLARHLARALAAGDQVAARATAQQLQALADPHPAARAAARAALIAYNRRVAAADARVRDVERERLRLEAALAA